MGLVPVFIVFFYHGLGQQIYLILAFTVFVIASATDAIDGYIARTRNLITNFGKLMDPLADKVLTTAAFIIFVDANIMPAWMVIVILAREFVITGLRGVAASEGVVIAANLSGKLKTVFQMAAICFVLLALAIGVRFRLGYDTFAVVEGGDLVNGFGAFAAYAGIVLIWVAVVFTVYSGVEYLWKGRKLLNVK